MRHLRGNQDLYPSTSFAATLVTTVGRSAQRKLWRRKGFDTSECATLLRALEKNGFFTYEDMVGKNFDGLSQYLGFQTGEEAEVPTSTGKAKVVRKKAVGNWRHWFTEEDVELFKPSYLPY